jgi:hypothetical protein
VEVRGNTGSCNSAGTLTVHGTTDVPLAVTADQHGDFVTRFLVPPGTYPKAYQLELSVDCNGQVQRAEGALTVVDHAPVPVDDSATTPQDSPVTVAVTGNDTDPDGDDGYPTLVFEQGQPTHGTTEIRPDGTIVYTPDPGFVGQDQFQYSNCDVLASRDAAGRWDVRCGTATVIVSTSPNCLPVASDIHGFHVAPVKGAGGARLRITATVDRKLAACPLRFLLGGDRFGSDVSVGPDGGISQDREVPGDAKPGTSTLRLASTGGQVLAEAPFEILAIPLKLAHWWQRTPFRLLAGGLAFLLGVLGRAAVRRWRRRGPNGPVPEHVRAELHPRPPRVTVDQDRPDTPNLTIRLQPYPDAGTQILEEVAG